MATVFDALEMSRLVSASDFEHALHVFSFHTSPVIQTRSPLTLRNWEWGKMLGENESYCIIMYITLFFRICIRVLRVF